MSQPKVMKGKAKHETLKLKVVHSIGKDGNGTPTVTSRQLDPDAVELKEEVGMGPKPATSGTSSKAKAGSAFKPASTTSERPANTDIQCPDPKCRSFNPFMAEFCRECGKPMKSVQAAQVAPNPLF